MREGGAEVGWMKRYRQQISYIFFGGLTTLVNYIVYFALSYLGVYYVVANGAALVVSILFAYGTNKYFVFQSRHLGLVGTVVEFGKFIGTRVFSAVVDMGLMIFLVSYLQTGEIFAKIFTGILVILLNYITSKCFTFRKKI